MQFKVALAGGLAIVAASVGLARAISYAPATATLGADECRGGLPQPQCKARPFVRTADVAWSGNGFARAAVAKDTIAGVAIHNQAHINDGYYGNGASWVSASADGWVKIDLGRLVMVDGVRLGRDRTGLYADRPTGGFVVALATVEGAYAAGSDVADATEYTKVFEATAAEVTNTGTGVTFVASFTPTLARYVKVQVKSAGAALDEVEVSGSLDRDACAVSGCGPTMTCTDLPGVDTGPAGRTCACGPGYATGADGGCVDVDECAADTDGCLEGCANQVGGFACTPDDAWMVMREPGFPGLVSTALLSFPAPTTLAAVRVPSSALGPTARLVVSLPPGPTVAVGATVARSAGPTTELPLPYTVFPGRQYLFVIETSATTLNLGVSIPHTSAAFAVLPDTLTLTPAAHAPTSPTHNAAARGYAVELARPMILTGVSTPPGRAGAAPFAVQVTDRATGAVVVEATGLGPVALTAPLDAGRGYLVTYKDPSGGLRLPEVSVATAAACAPRAAAGTVNVLTYQEPECVDGGGGGATSVWVAPEPVVLHFNRLPLAPPLVGESTRTIAAGGVTARAYEVKAITTTSISAVVWTMGAATPELVEARIWDDRGVLLARGQKVLAATGVTALASPLTFTFEAGRTYRVGFTTPRSALTLPLRDLGPDAGGVVGADVLPYRLGGLSVEGVRSTRGGEADVAPTAGNAYAPLFELVLTPGACAQGTCR
jgi:hypothetical protein